MFRPLWLSRQRQWPPEDQGIEMKDEDARTMENQPIEVLQLAFKARRILKFANRTKNLVNMGDMAVVSVDRGEDLGRVVAKLPPTVSNMERIDGNLLRIATDIDMENFRSNSDFEKEVLEHCETRIKVRNIDMRLTDCEAQLDRNRIRLFFTADQRTDFRGLVRDMASAFRARIEMRQIGVRDDAKYKDGVGICGRQLCCAGFLNEFKSVSLKSVRDQHLSPNPSKVSGACSRLMCCLEYETEFYHKASKTYPRIGLKLKVNGLHASVKETDIFVENVTLLWEESGVEEILTIEDFHRRRTMTQAPCEEKACNSCPGSVSKQKTKQEQKPQISPLTQSRPVESDTVTVAKADDDKEKPEKKNRSRVRSRYRRSSNKKEVRES